MVTSNTSQVASHFLRPRRIYVGRRLARLVLEVSSSHHLEGLGAVEVNARRRLNIQAGLSIEDRRRKGHVDPMERINHVGKLIKIRDTAC